MRPSPALRAACIALAASLAACRSATDAPPPVARIGQAHVTIESASGTRTIDGMEAAFYVYNQGPTADTRAMYLSLGTRERKAGAFSLDLYQVLADRQESPADGAFTAQRSALGTTTMGASVLFVEDGILEQFFPSPDSANTVTIDGVSRFIDGERAFGSFDIWLYDGASQDTRATRRIRGEFSAERVTDLQKLPTVR